MLPATSTPWRAARSLAAGAVCATTAGAAHVLGGGVTSPAAVLGSATAVALVAAALSGRRIVAAQFVGLLILAQAALHVASPGDPMAHGPSMIALHLAATAASAAFLTRGEAVLWAFVARYVLRALPVVRETLVVRPARVCSTPPRASRSAAIVVDRGMRGPPVGIA